MNVEFGAKINISEYGGIIKIDTINWDAYNESVNLKKQVQRYLKTFGCYPELVMDDRFYLTRGNRAWLKSMDIGIVEKPLVRPPKVSALEKRKLRKKCNQSSKWKVNSVRQRTDMGWGASKHGEKTFPKVGWSPSSLL